MPGFALTAGLDKAPPTYVPIRRVVREGIDLSLVALRACCSSSSSSSHIRSRAPSVRPFLRPSQGSRPTARGKRRSRRGEDKMAFLTRKVDRWIDDHPKLYALGTLATLALVARVFWAVAGDAVAARYAAWLGPAVDPWLRRRVWPHFKALGMLAREEAPWMEKAAKAFTPKEL